MISSCSGVKTVTNIGENKRQRHLRAVHEVVISGLHPDIVDESFPCHLVVGEQDVVEVLDDMPSVAHGMAFASCPRV